MGRPTSDLVKFLMAEGDLSTFTVSEDDFVEVAIKLRNELFPYLRSAALPTLGSLLGREASANGPEKHHLSLRVLSIGGCGLDGPFARDRYHSYYFDQQGQVVRAMTILENNRTEITVCEEPDIHKLLWRYYQDLLTSCEQITELIERGLQISSDYELEPLPHFLKALSETLETMHSNAKKSAKRAKQARKPVDKALRRLRETDTPQARP